MTEIAPCPWCGHNMDKLENGEIDGHTWYRDDSDYIQNIERSRDFMKKRLEQFEQLEELCRELYEEVEQECWVTAERHYRTRMDALGLLEGEQE